MKNIGLLTYRNFIVGNDFFINIGDYIQTVACINIMRKVYNKKHGTGYGINEFIDRVEENNLKGLNFVIIPRDNISSANIKEPVWIVMNGYFMISTNFGDVCSEGRQPIYDWNVPNNFRPLFTSFHISEQIYPIVFQLDKIRHLKNHEPIGCRDYGTMELLRKNGIKSYFSGCLTLTLDLFGHKAEDGVRLIDVDGDDGIRMTNVFNTNLSSFDLYRKAVEVLRLYSRAEKVTTSRLHAFLPCLAMGVPVEFIPENENDIRFGGLMELQNNQPELQKIKKRLNNSVSSFFKKII